MLHDPTMYDKKDRGKNTSYVFIYFRPIVRLVKQKTRRICAGLKDACAARHCAPRMVGFKLFILFMISCSVLMGGCASKVKSPLGFNVMQWGGIQDVLVRYNPCTCATSSRVSYDIEVIELPAVEGEEDLSSSGEQSIDETQVQRVAEQAKRLIKHKGSKGQVWERVWLDLQGDDVEATERAKQVLEWWFSHPSDVLILQVDTLSATKKVSGHHLRGLKIKSLLIPSSEQSEGKD